VTRNGLRVVAVFRHLTGPTQIVLPLEHLCNVATPPDAGARLYALPAPVIGVGLAPGTRGWGTARAARPSLALASATSMPCRRRRFSPRIFRLASSVSCG
jgi:hypothetical protein